MSFASVTVDLAVVKEAFEKAIAALKDALATSAHSSSSPHLWGATRQACPFLDFQYKLLKVTAVASQISRDKQSQKAAQRY